MFLATCARRLRCKQKPQLDSARCPCPCRTLRTWPPGPNSKSGAQTLCWELCLHLLGLLPGKRSPDSLLLGACQRCSAQCLQSHVVVYSSDGLARLGSEILQFFRTLQPTAAQKMQSLSCRHWILQSCVQRSLMRCRSFPKPCGVHAAGYSVYRSCSQINMRSHLIEPMIMSDEIAFWGETRFDDASGEDRTYKPCIAKRLMLCLWDIHPIAHAHHSLFKWCAPLTSPSSTCLVSPTA